MPVETCAHHGSHGSHIHVSKSIDTTATTLPYQTWDTVDDLVQDHGGLFIPFFICKQVKHSVVLCPNCCKISAPLRAMPCCTSCCEKMQRFQTIQTVSRKHSSLGYRLRTPAKAATGAVFEISAAIWRSRCANVPKGVISGILASIATLSLQLGDPSRAQTADAKYFDVQQDIPLVRVT